MQKVLFFLESFIIGLSGYSLATKECNIISMVINIKNRNILSYVFPMYIHKIEVYSINSPSCQKYTICNLTAVHVLGGFTSQLAHVRRWNMAFARW